MFDRRFAWTGAAVAAITALSFFISKSPEAPQITPITENVSGIERRAEASSAKPDYEYLIKEHDGHVAVYSAGAAEPELVLDVLVKYLPDFDRSQMEKGIPVKDRDQLAALLEDYTS